MCLRYLENKILGQVRQGMPLVLELQKQKQVDVLSVRPACSTEEDPVLKQTNKNK